MVELAQELYEAYCEQTGWKSAVTGTVLPQWGYTMREVQDAWRAVAAFVERRIEEEYVRRDQDGPF